MLSCQKYLFNILNSLIVWQEVCLDALCISICKLVLRVRCVGYTAGCIRFHQVRFQPWRYIQVKSQLGILFQVFFLADRRGTWRYLILFASTVSDGLHVSVTKSCYLIYFVSSIQPVLSSDSYLLFF